MHALCRWMFRGPGAAFTVVDVLTLLMGVYLFELECPLIHFQIIPALGHQ